jgi:hypothetical protein
MKRASVAQTIVLDVGVQACLTVVAIVTPFASCLR